MTAKEVASKVHHCSNKETTERVIQAAMDSARGEALDEAAQVVLNSATAIIGARDIWALKTAKPAPASGPVTHGVDTHAYRMSSRSPGRCGTCRRSREDAIHKVGVPNA